MTDGAYPPERKQDVDADAFFDLDLRIGEVVDVEEFPEARIAAWKVTVDFGDRIGRLRTSARITNYPRQQLLGRRVVGAINLGTKRIAGFESQFLVLGGIEEDGTVLLLGVDGDPPNGAPVA